ncbi:MAG: hypothetical protein EOP48_05915, partial [Sphingobacteriales bacterium]
MSTQNSKQFGIWMDSQHATLIGKENADSTELKVIHTAKNEKTPGNSNENAGNNQEKTNLQKYFKEIASHMQNADSFHVTGPGTIQEQFIKYMADTPQFKNATAKE